MARRDGIKAGWRTKNFCPLWPPPSSGVTKGYRDAWKISLLILVGKKKRCEIIFFRLLWIFVFFFFFFTYVCLYVCSCQKNDLIAIVLLFIWAYLTNTEGILGHSFCSQEIIPIKVRLLRRDLVSRSQTIRLMRRKPQEARETSL